MLCFLLFNFVCYAYMLIAPLHRYHVNNNASKKITEMLLIALLRRIETVEYF